MRKLLATAAVAVLITSIPAYAQRGRGGGPAPTPKDAAPVDLTGYWVSVVTEDWRYRMMTPAKGDHPSVPLNPAGVRLADSWDPAKDEAAGDLCKAYGAAGVMRQPGRLHITWQDDRTLKVEAEAGTQTRLFHFMGNPAQDNFQYGAQDIQGLNADMFKPSLQGLSLASWEYAGGRANLPNPRPAKMNLGDLKVVTKYAKPGYLQKNGVPYSADMLQTEFFNRTYEENGDSWLILTQIIEDPTYLRVRYARSTHYKKLADNNTAWEPEPCSAK